MVLITGQSVTIDLLREVAFQNCGEIRLSQEAKDKMNVSRKYIMDRVDAGDIIYGVNTGFGAFSSVTISKKEIEELQRNLIRSHSCGIGLPFTHVEVRAIMFLRANALANGHSGVRPDVVEKIIEFLNFGVIPVIPQQGSVGASGDLAPLSHLALALIGEGMAFENQKQVPVVGVLQEKGIEPLTLQAKEGLSLINGCQVMTAIGMLNAYTAKRLNWMADLAAAMTLEGLKGSRKAFDPIIFQTRPHPGEAKTARNLLKLLGARSPLSESHEGCGRVQDAYSLRCIPAVHGAAKDTIRHAIATLEIEANSSTDNPLVFPNEGKVLSCGNFHGEPVALCCDFLAIAMAAMANMSECRISKLINPLFSDLPAFLAPHGGLNSGHMIVQVAAASLVSENKILTHPASVDSIPTSVDKEDHVSMGTIAARKLGQLIKNAENIIAMEMLSAAQALDLRKPLEPVAAVKGAYELIRGQVPFAEKDRVFSNDIRAIKQLIRSDQLLEMVFNRVGNLEI